MDSGDKGNMTPSRGRPRWMEVSVLVLSLLLSACVAVIVYMSLSPAAVPPTAQSPTVSSATSPQRTINVNVEVDGKKMPEKMGYDEDRNILFLYDDNGNFIAEDYDKGLAISKIPRSSLCMVMPVGNNMTRSQVRSVVSTYSDGNSMPMERPRTVYAQVLPGFIQDTSMFPDEANERCTGGYVWVTTVDTEADGTFEVKQRNKRQLFEENLPRCDCRVYFFSVYKDTTGSGLETTDPAYKVITFSICVRNCAARAVHTCSLRMFGPGICNNASAAVNVFELLHPRLK